MQRFAFTGTVPLWGRCLAIAAVGALGQGLVSPIALARPFNPAGVINPRGAINADDYGDCVRDLQESGIETTNAVDVCAAAFDPDEVADCVEEINDDTTIVADSALGACLRVRRPDELADCVTDVDKTFNQEFSDDALAYCTRSLLPARFSDCVRGIRGDAEAAPIAIMDECVEANYSVPNLFIPGLEGIEATVPATMPQVDLDSLEP
ncbi:MAG: hypothetical protein ACFB5Z_14010 [Elainellaceae cyanobacterium]